MAKSTILTLIVEGADWKKTVKVDSDVFSSERDLLIEAGTQAIVSRFKNDPETLHLGPVIGIKIKGKKKEALVNSYICLQNASFYHLGEQLRNNYKQESGQDLSLDEKGYSWL